MRMDATRLEIDKRNGFFFAGEMGTTCRNAYFKADGGTRRTRLRWRRRDATGARGRLIPAGVMTAEAAGKRIVVGD